MGRTGRSSQDDPPKRYEEYNSAPREGAADAEHRPPVRPGFVGFEGNGYVIISPVAHRPCLERMGIDCATR